jgi:hypothetical protein
LKNEQTYYLAKKSYYVAESIDAANHVLEHLFLLGSQLCDETYHTAGFKIRQSECVAQLGVFINDARPGEQMNNSENAFVLLRISILTSNQ